MGHPLVTGAQPADHWLRRHERARPPQAATTNFALCLTQEVLLNCQLWCRVNLECVDWLWLRGYGYIRP